MRSVYFYIAAICIAVVSCNKTAPVKHTHFVKGQEATLIVSLSPTDTKATSSLDAEDGSVSFEWEDGDQIKVIMGEESSVFTLQGFAEGKKTATFTGTMPGEGEFFTAQYPASEPSLDEQTYVEGALPHNKMLSIAENCTIDAPFSLVPQYSALRLNLYGPKTLSKIVVTDKTASPNVAYTLLCPGVSVGAKTKDAESTPFLLVLPVGSRNFSVDVYDGESAIARNFETSTAKTFTANTVLNMPSKAAELIKYKEGSTDYGYGTPITGGSMDETVWAPENCGISDSNAYGLLYQWGRKYGQSYNTSELSDSKKIKSQATSIAEGNTAANSDKVYVKTGWSYNCWFINPTVNDEWLDEYNPCPEGWRVPTIKELETLVGGHTSGVAISTKSSIKGFWFDGTTNPGTSGVFLPAAGARVTTGGCSGMESTGSYWSIDANEDEKMSANGQNYLIEGGIVSTPGYSRARGISIRCVQK